MKPIKNFEHLYSITEDGRVFSHQKGRFMRITTKLNGYSFVALQKKLFPVARLVLEAYDEPAKGQPSHKDYNRRNNHISNLEWKDHSQIILKSRQDDYWEKSFRYFNKKSKERPAKEKPVKAIGEETLKFNSVKELLDHFDINRRKFNRYVLEKKKFQGYRFSFA
jgi:hypothetical protein